LPQRPQHLLCHNQQSPHGNHCRDASSATTRISAPGASRVLPRVHWQRRITTPATKAKIQKRRVGKEDVCPTSFKSSQGAERASMSCHTSCGPRSCLPTKEGSGAATCPAAPDLVSPSGRAPALSRVSWLWIPPPSGTATRPAALDTVSLSGRAPALPRVSWLSMGCG
jgi:hypothetical protein